MLARGALVHQTLVSGSPWTNTKVSSIPSSDRSHGASLVSCVRGEQHEARLAATRWPDKETVADQSQGAQLANLQELVRYWGTEYDWRKGEATLNAFPQFRTRIDGADTARLPQCDLLPRGRPGGHFAAWEYPELFAGELRNAFRSLRSPRQKQ